MLATLLLVKIWRRSFAAASTMTFTPISGLSRSAGETHFNEMKMVICLDCRHLAPIIKPTGIIDEYGGVENHNAICIERLSLVKFTGDLMTRFAWRQRWHRHAPPMAR